MKIEIHTPSQNSVITCQKGCFKSLTPKFLCGHKNFVLTDSNVYSLYREDILSVFGATTPVYVLPAGEESKTHQNLFLILQAMIDAELHRNSYLFAVGGGVVGDIGGLAASLYMRGIHCVQVPTTLLAQVDSSVGGKTAVDMGKVKNVVGAFYQPEAVLVDSTFLHTLPEREIRCGLGEIVKYGGLNGDIFNRLRSNIRQLSSLDFLAEITPDCIAHKADVVRRDEREANERKSLNMGHTTAHALELYYGNLSHGEFVLIGMYYELKIALDMGMVSPDYAEQLNELIVAVLGEVPKYANVSQAVAFAKLDKKNSKSDEVSMIVPTSHGQYAELKLAYEKYLWYMQQFANQP